MTDRPDVAVVGAGIVGLATAARLAERHRVVVVDKEDSVAAHQTGRNSGVIHSGVYYRPGSLKARLTRAGRAELLELCAAEEVAHEVCGKVIVATSPAERGALDELERRGTANGVRLEPIGPEALAEREPHVSAEAALLVHDAGIVDYVGVADALRRRVEATGGQVRLGTEVADLDVRPDGVRLATTTGDVEAGVLVNCAGLQSDRLARMDGTDPEAAIVPFRGEYHELRPEAEGLCRHLIYPVPDDRFPFLGVHLTRMVTGGVEVGPNAVLALAREGYRWRDVDLRDTAEVIGNPAMWRLARRYWRTGVAEMWRSASRRALARALQRLVPDLSVDDLVPAPSGVRAQALGRDGALLDDFVIRSRPRVVDVVNAPSPAATAALAIAGVIAAEVEAARA